MPLWLSVANSLMALGSAAFGVLALIRPEALNGPRGGGRALGECGGSGVRGDVEAARLYAAMYAGRAIPLGLAVSAAPDERATALLLGVAVAAQIADLVAAVANRLKGMAVGAAFAALVHAAALAATL